MATIGILIIIIGCVLGLVEWVRLVKNDAGAMAAQVCALETKIERLEQELIELKNDKELIEASVQKALEEKIINEKILAVIQEKLNIQNPNVLNK